MAIKLLIVDDHPMVREGLAAMLKSCEEIDVIGSCGNSKEAIKVALLREPDIILMDIKMEGTNGIETTRLILEQKPEIKVVMLTVFEDTESIRLALQAGAVGYILKHVSREKLLETIKKIYRGETVIDPSVLHRIVHDYTRLSRKVAATREDRPAETVQEENIKLTPREQEVLFHLVKGFTNKEISVATNLAVDTVKTHLRNIFRKMGVKNRTQAISRAVKIFKNPQSNYFLLRRLEKG
ncbi:MAG: response regulator [Dethiobacteria bacterium]